jgi:hypothetical protein
LTRQKKQIYVLDKVTKMQFLSDFKKAIILEFSHKYSINSALKQNNFRIIRELP